MARQLSIQETSDVAFTQLGHGRHAYNSGTFKVAVHVRAILLALFISLPAYKNGVQPYSPVDLTLLIAVVCMVFSVPVTISAVLSRGTKSKHAWRFLGCWIGLVSLVWVGVLNSLDPPDAIDYAVVITASTFIPTLLSLSVVRSREAMHQLLFSVFWIGVFLSLTAFAEGATEGKFARATVFGTNPILIGIAATWVPLIGFTVLWTTRPIMKIPVLLTTAVAFPVALSSARGPLIAAVVAIGLVSVLKGRKHFGYLIGSASIAFIAIPFFGPMLPEFGVERLRRLTDSVSSMVRGSDVGQIEGSVLTRMDLFSHAWNLFLDSPLLGAGTRAFAQSIQQVPHLSHLEWPHNILLQFAAEFGVVGIGLATIVFALAVGTVLKYRDDAVVIGIGALFGATLIEAMFSGDMNNRMLWGLTFLLIAIPWASVPAAADLRRLEVSATGSSSGL